MRARRDTTITRWRMAVLLVVVVPGSANAAIVQHAVPRASGAEKAGSVPGIHPAGHGA